jgi:hypothetical protein
MPMLSDVQHRAVLGEVDLLAVEHRFDAFAQPGLLGEFDEQAYRLAGHPVLRVVEKHPDRLEREPLAAGRVGVEELAQVLPADLLVMVGQSRPRGTVTEWRGHKP